MSGSRPAAGASAGSANPELQLERLVGRALREAPLRRAPSSLEVRVLQEIARRAALPWWRLAFSDWPPLAQAGFALISGAIAVVWLAATSPWADGGPLAGAWAAASSFLLPWARSALTLVDVAGELDASLTRIVPIDWLYGATAAGAILYAALFGLGAAAYRTLYLHPDSGDPS